MPDVTKFANAEDFFKALEEYKMQVSAELDQKRGEKYAKLGKAFVAFAKEHEISLGEMSACVISMIKNNGELIAPKSLQIGGAKRGRKALDATKLKFSEESAVPAEVKKSALAALKSGKQVTEVYNETGIATGILIAWKKEAGLIGAS